MTRRLGPVAAAIALVLAATLAAPATAQALPSPLDLLPDSLNPGDWAVSGFQAIIKWIVGDSLDELARELVNLLLAVPILTDHRSFPKLNEYRGYITGGCYGIVGLSFVISSMRYWVSGYTGGGTYEGMIGFARTVGALCMILAFPIAFDQICRIVNVLTAAIVTTPIVGHGLSHGFIGTISTAPLAGGGVTMVIGLFAIFFALILLLVKIIITSLLAVLFVLSPLAIALWPIEELSWALRTLLSAMGALLAFPVLWAVCFGTFAVLNVDAMFPGDHGDLLVAVLSPLIVLASLIIAFRLPFAVLNQAMGAGLASHGGRAMRTIHIVRNIGGGGSGSEAPLPGSGRVHSQQGRLFR